MPTELNDDLLPWLSDHTISIVIITHNQPTYLEKVLAGYSKQVQNPYEIIVAEDSTDPDTERVVSKFRREVDFPAVFQFNPQEVHRDATSRFATDYAARRVS